MAYHGRRHSGEKGEEIKRVRLPRNGEMFGQVVSLLGGGRLLVYSEDKKERVCRIPGKIKRFIRVREGDFIILKPWQIESDKRGDVVWRFTKAQVEWLRKHNKLTAF